MSEQDAPKQPRRFAPEAIETSSKSSKSTRRFAPEPIETTSKSSKSARRFAPEPIETSSKSSRKDKDKVESEGPNEPKSAPRRFTPQPVETSHKSSKDSANGKTAERDNSAHVKFKPQLVETVYGGNRSSTSSSRRTTQDETSTIAGDEATPRRFKPEILSTAKRSRRGPERKKNNAREYRTEEGFHVHAREHRKHAGWKTPAETHLAPPGQSASDHDFSSELRRHIAPLDGSASPTQRPLERNHSFRCPDLDTIESSESERESGPSSMSCSPGRGSPITASDSSYNDFPYKHATRERESVDENFSHYLLQLEAKKAHERLQEQALAAFPNSDFHEPIQHFVNDDQESDDMEIDERPSTWEGFDEEIFFSRARRESTSKVSWEQLEMQRHAEQLEQERNANKTTAARAPEHSPWWNPAAGLAIEQQDPDMQSMRDRARPPMLGSDLKFPRCPSPEPARFDVTQGSAKIRQQMLAESNNPVAKKDEKGGLWNATSKKPSAANDSTSSAASKAKSSTKGGGLWGGFCVGTPSEAAASPTPGLAPSGIPTGLMTPAPRMEASNPFEQSFAARNGGPSTLKKTPPTPPPEGLTGTDLANLDAVLVSDRDFEDLMAREYPDSFVTQVYNYLSLGYPTLARPFDVELSKISGIPISELREDDVKAKSMPKGYIRLDPAYEGPGGDGVQGDGCVRWRALKLYVREWARQEKQGYADAPGGNWGAIARRGSWAF